MSATLAMTLRPDGWVTGGCASRGCHVEITEVANMSWAGNEPGPLAGGFVMSHNGEGHVYIPYKLSYGSRFWFRVFFRRWANQFHTPPTHGSTEGEPRETA